MIMAELIDVDLLPAVAQTRERINEGLGHALSNGPHHEKPAGALTPTGSELNLNGAAAPNRRALARPLLSQRRSVVNGVLSVTQNGYVCFQRGWMNMPALKPGHDPFCRAAAWAWLVEHAHWADGQIDILGKTVQIKRGQLSTPLRGLAETWNWSVGAVRRFQERLLRDGEICIHSDTGQGIITICKYDVYTSHHRNMSTEPARDRHAVSTYINKEEGNKERKSTPLPPIEQTTLFEEAQPTAAGERDEEPAIKEARPSAQVLQMQGVATDRVAVMSAWNAMAAEAGLAKITAMSTTRIRSLNARLKEHGVDGVLLAIKLVGESDFCQGKSQRGWKADFDWLLTAVGIERTINGAYANKTSGRPVIISEVTGLPVVRLNTWL